MTLVIVIRGIIALQAFCHTWDQFLFIFAFTFLVGCGGRICTLPTHTLIIHLNISIRHAHISVHFYHLGPYFPETKCNPNTSLISVGEDVEGVSNDISAIFVTTSVGVARWNQTQCDMEDKQNPLSLGVRLYKQVESGWESIMANHTSSSHSL